MARLRIHIDGRTDRRSRRRIEQQLEQAGLAPAGAASREPSPIPAAAARKGLVLVLLVAAVVSAARNAKEPAIVLDGVEVRARPILVLKDTSPSMSDYLDRLQERLAHLRSAGGGVDLIEVDVVGSSAEDVSPVLARSLAELTDVDTVYFFSDFEDPSSYAAFQALDRALGDRRLRFYTASVELYPHPEWVAIARRSGGDLLQTGGEP